MAAVLPDDSAMMEVEKEEEETVLVRVGDYAVPSPLARSIHQVSNLFTKLRGMLESGGLSTAGTTFELEARFGRLRRKFTSDGRIAHSSFVPGVSEEMFGELIGYLEASDAWSSTTKWQQTETFIYTVEGLGDVRQTTHMDHTQEFITKERIDRTDLYCATDERFRPIADERGLDLRVALCKEQQLRDIPDRVPTTNTQCYRIRNRKSFVLDDMWTFDLTILFSGATHQEAELAFKHDRATYEVEVECAHPELLFAKDGCDALYNSIMFMSHILALTRLEASGWEYIVER